MITSALNNSWRASNSRKQNKTRPRGNTVCFYDPLDETFITREEFIRGKNKLVQKSIINRKAITKEAKELEIEAAYKLIDAKKIKPNKALDIVLDQLNEVYLNTAEYRFIFTRRNETGWTKSDRIPRGERLKVMMEIMGYIILSTNFANDFKILYYYKNTEASPSVQNMVDFFKLRNYSEPRVRRAYADCVKCGFITQQPRLVKKTSGGVSRIRSLPFIKQLSDAFLELIGISASLVAKLLDSSRNSWIKLHDKRKNQHLTRAMLLQKMMKDADDKQITFKKDKISGGQKNKAPPDDDETADYFINMMRKLTT